MASVTSYSQGVRKGLVAVNESARSFGYKYHAPHQPVAPHFSRPLHLP
jgi:hypothetical protein